MRRWGRLWKESGDWWVVEPLVLESPELGSVELRGKVLLSFEL